MTTANISLIFPTPILTASLEREFTKQELDFCSAGNQELVKNMGNNHSKDTYVLEAPELAAIKSECLKAVAAYMDVVVKPREDVTPYITQSWLNYTEKDQYMHKHLHTNSYLSGVIYIHAEKDLDKLYFHDQRYNQLALPAHTYDNMNSENWWFPVETGSIVIFPSSATHSVEYVTSNETRISLAFNVFLKGTLGCHDRLTELKLS